MSNFVVLIYSMNIVITGASKGLGKAFAKAFAKENNLLLLCSRNIDDLRTVANELVGSGASVHYQSVDVSKKDAVIAFGEWCLSYGTPDILINNEDSNYLIEQLINSASANLGVNYLAGGTTTAGFDCSGLMYSTFKKFDITLPRSSYEMAEVGTRIETEKAKKGDLIFFINRGQRRINHVGMIVDVNGDDIKFIHSSTQNGVVVSSLKESYYERTFKQINRIIE